MAIDSSAPATTMDRSCSSSSASDTSSGGGEPRPAGDDKTTGSETVCLKKMLQDAPPEYLTLWPTPGSAPAAAAYRRQKRTVEASLAGVDAPRDYLSLSVTPSENPKRRRGQDCVSGGGGSVVVADVSPAASTEGALVLVESVIRPPPPPVRIPEACLPPKSHPGRDVSAGSGSVVANASPEGALVLVESVIRPASPPLRIPEACLPPKKRKLAAAGFDATMNHDDGLSASRSSWPPRGSSRHSPATVASNPIDAVPLQAVYVHGGVSRPIRLGSSAGEITTNETAEGQAKKVA